MWISKLRFEIITEGRDNANEMLRSANNTISEMKKLAQDVVDAKALVAVRGCATTKMVQVRENTKTHKARLKKALTFLGAYDPTTRKYLKKKSIVVELPKFDVEIREHNGSLVLCDTECSRYNPIVAFNQPNTKSIIDYILSLDV